MGDAAVSALVKEVLGILTSELIKEFGLLRRFKGDILALKEDFEQIQAVLEDAEEKQVKEKAVELWLRRLRSASLKVENVLDGISTEALLRSLHKEIDIERGIKIGIKYKMWELKVRMPNRETSSLILDSSKILGRDEEVEMVTRTICNKDIGKYDNGEILVYGIWGMGGLGKTTLAQLVYNHERVDQYFDLRCWVYVSQNFQNEEGKWKTLSGTLSCGAEGSIVVMTTRLETTCRMMAKAGELRHQLGCLSEENSWLLFKKHAFAQGRVGDDIRKLEPIGREIVVKCNGLPLAVKTLGSLMWSKSSSKRLATCER
ncbi:putative virus X resistance protein-like, coiled-coil [Helianthus annuus]|nr:putative virus X resistance protein-like, coiled-coil [Helianthus annuus]